MGEITARQKEPAVQNAKRSIGDSTVAGRREGGSGKKRDLG